MKQIALLVKFTDDVQMNVQFKADTVCAISVNNEIAYEFSSDELGNVKFSQKLKFNKKALALITEVNKSDFIEKDSEGLQNCINCGGITYCITNGCANTPCGWICDNCC
nr:hypothetical protein [Mucilaginibacter sp. L294]